MMGELPNPRKRAIMKVSLSLVSLLIVTLGYLTAPTDATSSTRTVINLNGTWNIAEGTMDDVPESFTYKVPVPGLVDMSSPDFFEVGIESDRREAFWYQRTFTVGGDIPASALLKIHKAKYGKKVYLNGSLVGEHLPCFTPGYFDIRPYVKGNNQPNDLIIRVGANITSVPKSIPNGWDFEKYKYIPGIYDNVEVILSGTPRIVNVQTAPRIEEQALLVHAEIASDQAVQGLVLDYRVTEAATGKVIAVGKTKPTDMAANAVQTLPFTVLIPDCQLWSPENPFLYHLHIQTPADSLTTRFAMRSFRFDANTGRAMLNGKPYLMRGTNVCIYRFFEDAERGSLPWNPQWVRQLHQKFQSMHWNCIRYCIGFPPEFWYDIADELGILIQDEFPIWSLGEWPEELKADAIAREYTEWMRERWNHPSVVWWDAQNESRTEETGKALMMVRDLDLSNRPWDNGWAEPQSETDTIETHPYFFNSDMFQKKPFQIETLKDHDGTPRIQEVQKGHRNPLIINEYAWLWINRDGSTTSLTNEVYFNLLGENSTTEQRRERYARYLAALSEFWRAKRKCAAVMHFCGLGYSRPGGTERPVAGATSDHFIDVAHLTFEPNFWKYVRDAFAPVGVMIDVWSETFKAGEIISVPVYITNDPDTPWSGLVRVRIQQGDTILSEQSQVCHVEGLGSQQLEFAVTIPKKSGTYDIVGELVTPGSESVFSYRFFTVD
jgi:beta-galactosidase